MNKKELKKTYGFDIISIERLNIRSVNPCFKIIAAQGKFFMKKIFKRRRFRPQEIESQIDIANHLHEKGFLVFVPVKNKKGKQLSKVEEDYYLVYEYHNLEKADNTKRRHLKIATNLLVDFHEAMKDYSGKEIFQVSELKTDICRVTSFTEGSHDKKTKATVELARRSKTSFARKVLKDTPLIKEAIIRALHYMQKAKFTEKTILHYDYGPHNIFFSGRKLLAVSDFDYSHKEYIELDVAKAAKFWAEKEDKSIDVKRFKRFIKLYHKKKGTPIDWDTYYGLTIYIILRRLVHAADYTLTKKKDLEFLYDWDIRAIKQLMKRKKL